VTLIDFLSNPATGAASTTVEGVVTRAPASTSDLLHVAIPSFDDQQEFGPCPWQPNGGTLPTPGQRVLVVISDQQAPWAFLDWQT
jgi:hypothetical protein